jgi:hypothetical protein
VERDGEFEKALCTLMIPLNSLRSVSLETSFLLAANDMQIATRQMCGHRETEHFAAVIHKSSRGFFNRCAATPQGASYEGPNGYILIRTPERHEPLLRLWLSLN